MTTPESRTTAWFDRAFVGVPVMAILRNYTPERTVELAGRAWDLGIEQVEVPIQSPDAVPALEAAIAAAAERGRGVGAGTVTTIEQVRLAAEVGATFTVSPGLDIEVVRESLAVGVPHLPGVATPSEIQLAGSWGLAWVKAFPAASLGAPWVRAVRAPFPEVRVVATGGIHAGNAGEFLDAGARVVAVGSALEDPTELERLLRGLHGPGGATRR